MTVIYTNNSAVRVSWEILSVEVDKLYAKEFDENDTRSITEHCEFIAEFIRSCGWDEEEYLRSYFNEKAAN